MCIFGPPREIVGIAKTIKDNSVGEPDTADISVPLEQHYSSQITGVVSGTLIEATRWSFNAAGGE